MRLERRTLTGDPAALAAEIRALAPPPPDVAEVVAEIIARVRAEGDAALIELTEQLDGAMPTLVGPRVERHGRAWPEIGAPYTPALERAAANVAAVARAQITEDTTVTLPEGQTVTLRDEPVRSAAVYVPGGRAPYPSTVIMGAVTAKAAGVGHVVVCSPPPISTTILAACAVADVDDVIDVGGAQAIAALAYGTETVQPVDVIVGPGNAYVTEAKRQVYGQVGIDGLAGPSELVVVIEDADAVGLVALDLGAQAEHGEGSLVVAVSSSPAILDALAAEIGEGDGVPCVLVEADDPLELADALAPEHLQLVGVDEVEGRIAGCVFVGPQSATAFGDYVAGSNHVLPTGGAARFSSGLGPRVFRRRFSEVRVGEAGELARAGAEIARVEGFEVHARSMEARIDHNGGRS
jgi:histidinol dehydrogenase